MKPLRDKPIVLSAADRARFLGKVQRGAAEECWPWRGGRFKDGYGQFSVTALGERQNLRSNRVSYFIANGAIPMGMDVCHSCELPHAKLDPEKVRTIRRRVADGESVVRLAREFGLSVQSMRKVVDGRSWAHVLEAA